MSTRAQRRANRRNAQLSTGPKTEEGKAASSLNNFRHGLAGRLIVAALSNEDAAEFQELAAALRSEHDPQTPTEVLLVERMIESFWMSSRAVRLQSAALDSGDDRRLSLLLRYQTTHERAFLKCLNELAKLRKEKRQQEIGFDSQKQKQELHEAKIRALDASTEARELDTEVRTAVDAPMPGNTRLPLSTLKRIFDAIGQDYDESQASAA